MNKQLTQSEGQAFTCDHCTAQAVIGSPDAGTPSGWFSLQGFTDTVGQTLHACSPACSAEIRTKHKRTK